MSNQQQQQQNQLAATFAEQSKAKSTREILSQLVDLVGTEDDIAHGDEMQTTEGENRDASTMEQEKEFLEAEVTAMKQTLADLQGLEKQQEQSGKSQLHLFQSMASIQVNDFEYDSEEDDESSDDESDDEEEEFDLSDLRASQQIDDIRANAVLLLGRADELHEQVTSLKETKRQLQMQLVATSRRFLQTEMTLVDDDDDDDMIEENEEQAAEEESQAQEQSEEIAVATESIPTAFVLPSSESSTETNTNNVEGNSSTDTPVLVASSAWVVPASEQKQDSPAASAAQKSTRAGLSRQAGSTAVVTTTTRKAAKTNMSPALPTTKNNDRLKKMKQKRVVIQRVSTITGGVAGALVLGPIGIFAGAAVGHFSSKAAGRARERHCQRKLIKEQEAQNRLEQTALSTLREVSEEADADESKENLPVATPVFA